MGIMVKTATKTAISGTAMKDIIENFRKVKKEEGDKFEAYDYAIGNSANYGKYIVLINDKAKEFMYAPASSFDTIEATIDNYGVEDFNDIMAKGVIFEITKTRSKSGRDYFNLAF